MIALALVAAFASDSWGQSQRKTPPREETKSAQQTAGADQRGTEQSPAFVKIIPAPKTAEETEADRKEKEQKDANDTRLVWFTGLLAGIAFLQLLVFGWQGVQLKLAVSAAKAATELGNKEFISTHRPRMTVYGLAFGGSIASPDPVPISFRYVNSGDSDATVTGIGSHVFRLSGTSMPGEVEFTHQEIRPPIDFPSGMHGIRLTPGSIHPDVVIAAGVMDTDKIVCVGYVLYRDGNGTRRQTGFCRYFDIEAGRWIKMEDDEYEYSY